MGASYGSTKWISRYFLFKKSHKTILTSWSDLRIRRVLLKNILNDQLSKNSTWTEGAIWKLAEKTAAKSIIKMCYSCQNQKDEQQDGDDDSLNHRKYLYFKIPFDRQSLALIPLPSFWTKPPPVYPLLLSRFHNLAFRNLRLWYSFLDRYGLSILFYFLATRRKNDLVVSILGRFG